MTHNWSLGKRATTWFCFLHEFIPVNHQGCKEVAFTDDSIVTWKIERIKTYWVMLHVGPLTQLLPKAFQNISYSKKTIFSKASKTLQRRRRKTCACGSRKWINRNVIRDSISWRVGGAAEVTTRNRRVETTICICISSSPKRKSKILYENYSK